MHRVSEAGEEMAANEEFSRLKIYFSYPDSCQVTQAFLQSLSNAEGDPKAQGEALQIFVNHVRVNRSEGNCGHGKELASWAALLLERPVFIRALKSGLEGALLERKCPILQEDMRAKATENFVYLLQMVAIDERTTKFVLKAIPNLFDMFASYLINEGRASSKPEWLHLYVMGALSRLTPWSKSLQIEIGSNPEFLKAILQKILKDGANEPEGLQRALIIMHNSILYTKITHSLAIPLVELAAKVLAESEVPADMMCASYFIQVLDRFYPQFHQLLLEHKSLIRSSLAISTCQNALDLTKKTAERVLALFHPQLRQLGPKELQSMIEQRTASDPAASRRADRLRRVVFAETNYTPDQPRFLMKRVKDFPYTPGKMPSFKKDECKETFILGPPVEKKARRKCSFSGCSATESRSGQFKVCSNCRLATYCSQGECVNGVHILRPSSYFDDKVDSLNRLHYGTIR